MENKISYLLMRPGGNDTILVTSPFSRASQREVSLMLLESNPTAEQVVFCENDGKRAQMAGGEFCCNAARSFGYYLLGGKDGVVSFEMSGLDSIVTIKIGSNKSKAIVPIGVSIDRAIKKIGDDLYLVRMKGITHLVIMEKSGLYLKSRNKSYADEILNKFNLKNEQAAGVLFFSDNNEIEPYVYVSDTKTLYAETACGSGSIACCMLKAFLERKTFEKIDIMQPSGMVLETSVTADENVFVEGTVDGEVEIIKSVS